MSVCFIRRMRAIRWCDDNYVNRQSTIETWMRVEHLLIWPSNVEKSLSTAASKFDVDATIVDEVATRNEGSMGGEAGGGGAEGGGEVECKKELRWGWMWRKGGWGEARRRKIGKTMNAAPMNCSNDSEFWFHYARQLAFFLWSNGGQNTESPTWLHLRERAGSDNWFLYHVLDFCVYVKW